MDEKMARHHPAQQQPPPPITPSRAVAADKSLEWGKQLREALHIVVEPRAN